MNKKERITLLLPKPPSVPGWRLYRRGHGRHGGGRQHLGCLGNSVRQSRAAQSRAGGLRDKASRQETQKFGEGGGAWGEKVSRSLYSPQVAYNNQQ